MPKPTLALAACLLTLLSTARPATAQDAAAGEKVFKSQCMTCHAAVQGRKGIGPSLYSIVGSPAGMVPDFHYSEAMKTAGLTWDAATLDRYLLAPKQMLPGTTMTYAGLKNDGQRTDLIAYLATLK